jgi:hypothetical protein
MPSPIHANYYMASSHCNMKQDKHNKYRHLQNAVLHHLKCTWCTMVSQGYCILHCRTERAASYIELCYNSMQNPSCTVFTNIIFIPFPRTYGEKDRNKTHRFLGLARWEIFVPSLLPLILLCHTYITALYEVPLYAGQAGPFSWQTDIFLIGVTCEHRHIQSWKCPSNSNLWWAGIAQSV